jgi:hypothetical protein
VAWGVGFQYEYHPDAGILDIKDAKKEKPLIYVDFDRSLSKETLAYVNFFEKATQINALMFSNNMTIDLSETFDDARLVAILEDSAKMARYALDIKRRKFKEFSRNFCDEYDLHSLEIKKIAGFNPQAAFYSAQLMTRHLNMTSVRGPSLSKIMAKLSESTVQDLVTAEFGHYLGGAAHNLLNVSSKFSAIGRILDSEFCPARIVSQMQQRRNSLSA